MSNAVAALEGHASAQAAPRGLGRARERLALAAVFALLAARYWLTVYPHVSAHLRRARARARSIPYPMLRELVLSSLDKRSNIEGAAAFAVLAPRATRRGALRALLAFQTIYNYADVLAEQPDAQTRADARRAHLPLAYALGAGPPIASLYARGPWMRDTGYLADHISRCREAIAELPSGAAVRESALRSAADIAEFQAHSRPAAAPAELERWARSHQPRTPWMSWWETSAACGSSLTVHALIAAAASPGLQQPDVQRLVEVYGGPVGALHSMLDSLVDQDEDARLGQPSLICLYPSALAATRALGAMANAARCAARGLPHGHRHAVLLGAMAALYLSDPQARTARAAPLAAAVRSGIGLLATPAMAVFAVRRLAARRTRPTGILRAVQQSACAEHAEPERAPGACPRAG